MKDLIVASNRVLGEALLKDKLSTFQADQKFGRRKEETFGCYTITDPRKEKTEFDDVYVISTESVKHSDWKEIQRATDLAQSGSVAEARKVLDACGSQHTPAWVRADEMISAFSLQDVRRSISQELRMAVFNRSMMLSRCYDTFPGGISELQRQKAYRTPGPGALLHFHAYVTTHGELPPNSFGVRDLRLEDQPRGAYAHHVGWMRELYDKPGLWLDIAWWVTLDVIDLFSPSKLSAESAKERIKMVPSGLRSWYAWELMTVHGVEEFDAETQAYEEMQELLK